MVKSTTKPEEKIAEGKKNAKAANKKARKNKINKEAKKLSDKQLLDMAAEMPIGQANEFLAANIERDKIDSDQEQELSQAFGIRSIPTCVLMANGKPLDGFMGAVPESQIRAFLDKHLPSEDEVLAEEDALDAQALLAAGDPQAALHKLHEALSINPGNDDARYDYVKLLIESNQFDDAQAALAPALSAIPRQIRFEALEQFLDAIRFVATDPRGAWTLAAFDEQIAANRRDFDTRLAKARVLLVQGDWTAAMDELL